MKLIRYTRLTAVAIAIAAFSANAGAATPDDNDELTIQEQIDRPEISAKASAPLIRHFERMGNVFGKHGLAISYERKGEILCVTIPASELFAPNEKELRKGASKYLTAFRDLVKLPNLYRVLVVAHSDGTGSTTYNESLTWDRAFNIIDYFESLMHNDNLNIVPYGVGNDEPLLPDTSIGNRAANRRIDFIIIPEAELVEQARTGHL